MTDYDYEDFTASYLKGDVVESPGYGIMVSNSGVLHLLRSADGDVWYEEITYAEAAHLHALLGAVIE